jgi:hypothetical protein
MAANFNKILSGGLPTSIIKRITTSRTSVVTIASPSDGSDLREIFTAGTNGGFIDQIDYQFVHNGTPPTQGATLIYIWMTNSSGANAEIKYVFTVLAGSLQSNTTAGQSGSFKPQFYNIEPGVKFYASVPALTTNSECLVSCLGGQYETQ